MVKFYLKLKKSAAGHLFPLVAEFAIRFCSPSGKVARFHDRLLELSEAE